MPAPIASSAGRRKRFTAQSSATAHAAPRTTKCRAVSGCPARSIITKTNVSNPAALRVCSRTTRRTPRIKRGNQTVVAPNGHSSQKATKVENMNAAAPAILAISFVATAASAVAGAAEGSGTHIRFRSSTNIPSPAINSDSDARNVRLFGSGSRKLSSSKGS